MSIKGRSMNIKMSAGRHQCRLYRGEGIRVFLDTLLCSVINTGTNTSQPLTLFHIQTLSVASAADEFSNQCGNRIHCS